MSIFDYTDPKRLPQPYPSLIRSAQYKSSANDFIVEEVMPSIEFTGTGEHLWIQIKKTGMNTSYLAKQLAKWAGIAQRDVGYSGLKDRNAITTQWFSLRIPRSQAPLQPFAIDNSEQQESAEILQQLWHNKKLHRSTHKSNKFTIILRNIILNNNSSNKQQLEQKLTQIKQQGVPNYFGEQRFGHDGNNLTLALEWFQQGTIHGRKPHPKKSRDLQSILLSSARSAIFNQILAHRVQDSSWHQGLDGEVFNLAGTGSLFSSETLNPELQNRISTGDIYPTGALWGIESKIMPTGEALALEQQVINSNQLLQQLAQGLENKAIKQARRPLCLPVTGLNWQWLNATSSTTTTNVQLTHRTNSEPLINDLELSFELPSGSFATSVLASLIGEDNNYSQ